MAFRLEEYDTTIAKQAQQELFERIGPVSNVQILYDRSDRSRGTAFVTYSTSRDAQRALRDYNGANAYGQPISVSLMPSGPSGGGRPAPSRGLDERISAPQRSLFDRIDDGGGARRGGRGERTRRSESPRSRRSDVRGPAPEYIDRYVPGGSGRDDSRRRDRDRSRSPIRRGERGERGGRGLPRRGGRRDERDDRSTRPKGEGEGRPRTGARPRKTADELDAEMEDYWGGANGREDNVQKNEPVGGAGADAGGVAADVPAAGFTGGAAAQQDDMDDIDMIE